jgi:hypothetical protein
VLVDAEERHHRRAERLVPVTRYGQLLRILGLQLKASPLLNTTKTTTILLAVIQSCKLSGSHASLDIHYYPDGAAGRGFTEVVDLQCVQCVVARALDRKEWGIMDRSGSLARAVFVEGDDP